ncbi:hypothetical protein HBA54_12985 [Pelagibius litoralis]|uniref:Peptidase propeptide and YPEB domain-containing protein n=1 Tax=Pelagibius litoralis TaxID=374515 RepID=A0A967K9U5_9PROT|nr:hypothetical protein [Pelagibius litoralis]NIA69509.1 hypothetical protein [Pelagibius litoralis]
MPRSSRFRSFWLAGLCALALGFAATPSQAAVSEEAAAKLITEQFGVEVLRIRAGDLDGRPVWFVTVMQPEGSSNATFQVHILAVDQESGRLLPSFRHRSSGYESPPPAAGGGRP